MNPALLNYIQQRQLDQTQQSSNQETQNPFDSGIRRAIESARESLGMNQAQQHQAIRDSMGAFSNALNREPPKRGFWNNVFDIGKSLGPAVAQYGATEQGALAENNNIANQILNYQRQQAEAKAREEERAWNKTFAERQFAATNDERNWHRTHAENQLREQKRAHEEAETYRKEALEKKYEGERDEQIQKDVVKKLDKIAPKMLTDSNRDKITNSYTLAGEVLHETENIQEGYEKLKAAMEEAGIDTTSPIAWNGAIRNASSLTSSFTKDPKLRKVAQEYASLQNASEQLRVALEGKLRGGIVTRYMIEYAEKKGLFPVIGKDNFDIFHRKLNDLNDRVRENYNLAAVGASTGRAITPQNSDKVKELLGEEYMQDLILKHRGTEGEDDFKRQNQEVPPSSPDTNYGFMPLSPVHEQINSPEQYIVPNELNAPQNSMQNYGVGGYLDEER